MLVIGIAAVIGFLGLTLTKGNAFSALFAGYDHRPFTLWQRVLTESRVVLFYVSLLLYPMPDRLSLVHGFEIYDLTKIRHWEIRLGDYRDITNESATGFIDPPYQFGGEWYVKGNQGIDFCELASWAQSRLGQVIVCENTKADWLPFYPMRKMTGAYDTTTEAIWSNYPHDFQARQLCIPMFAAEF